MPLPAAAIGALISTGGDVLSQGINAFTNGMNNRKSRKFAKQQAQQQRDWALSDWNMQNAYNHPSSQMQRLREAGLNPNLVYGNGADTTSGPIRDSAPAQWHPEPPKFDFGAAANAGLSSYYNAQVQQAQIDNLRVQNTVLTQDALLKAAQVINTTETTSKVRGETQSILFDNQYKSDLREISMEAAKLGVQKQKADIDYTLDQNDRAAAQNSASVQEAAERILRSRAERTKIPLERQQLYAQIQSIKRDTRIKDLDIALKEKGVQPGDNLIIRAAAQAIRNPIEKAKELRNRYGLKLMDKYKNWNLRPR